jgi:Na+/H+ antiporter NhaA
MRVFLLTLAVVDDLGAILALFTKFGSGSTYVVRAR